MMSIRVPVDKGSIAAFCHRNYIRRLAFFGSVLRDDFCPESDIDILVEFQPAHVPGLLFFAMQDELGRMFGRKVDLHTPASLGGYFRDQVLSEAEPAYVEA